jgi:O-antigen/teichoic acid export membrane protein
MAGTLLAVLMPVGLAKCLFAVNAALFLGAGRSDMAFRLQLAVAAATLAGIASGAAFGVVGVAVGYAIISLAAIPASYAAVMRLVPLPSREIAAVFGPATAASAAMLVAVVAALRVWRTDLGPMALLALGIAAGVASYGAMLAAISGRRLYAELKTFRHPAPDM